MADPLSRGSAGEPVRHTVKRTWTVAAITCGKCDLLWEQPNYEDDGGHWVCPRCLHAAKTGTRDG